MNAQVSRRVAWALNGATLDRQARADAADAVITAESFDDLPDWLRDFVLEREATAAQLDRRHLAGMTDEQIVDARTNGRLDNLLRGPRR